VGVTYRDFADHPKKCYIPQDMPKEALEALIAALENWAAFFTLLVVLGVGGELVVHVMQSRANKKLITLQHLEALAQQKEIARLQNASASVELEIAKANEGAATAVTKAAQAEENLGAARKEAALANERAAEANKIAEGERLARLKIEEKLAPRSLGDEQRKRIESKLKPFAGTPYELALNPVPEATNLLNIIVSVLRSSGWVSKDSAKQDFRFVFTLDDGHKVEQAFVSGIVLQGTRTFVGIHQRAIDALAFALKEEGLEVRAELLKDDDPSPDALHITIGSK
jgi:cell division protein FtsB